MILRLYLYYSEHTDIIRLCQDKTLTQNQYQMCSDEKRLEVKSMNLFVIIRWNIRGHIRYAIWDPSMCIWETKLSLDLDLSEGNDLKLFSWDWVYSFMKIQGFEGDIDYLSGFVSGLLLRHDKYIEVALLTFRSSDLYLNTGM